MSTLKQTINRGPPSVPTDTDAKLLGDQVATNSESPYSSSDEEELEVQHWRKEKFLREEYIHSTMVGYRHYCYQYTRFTLHSPSIFRSQLN